MMGYGFGSIWMILIWIVIIVGIIYFIRAISKQSGHREDNSSPLEILKKRYASGEISKEEFEQARKNLLGQ